MPRMLICVFGVVYGCMPNPGPKFVPRVATPPSAPTKANTSGMLMGSPLGWTTATEGWIHVKVPGFAANGAQNLPPTVPGVDFSTFVPRLLQGLPSTRQSPLLAMSLGIDVINTVDKTVNAANLEPPDAAWPAGSYPVLVVGAHGWYAIEFTVDSDQLDVGDPPLAADILPAGDRDASVFCYVLPESSTSTGGQYLLPDETESTRVLEPGHLGIVVPNEQLQAINLHMGLYQSDVAIAGQYTRRELPKQPTIYFTVRPEFIAQIGAAAIASAWQVNQNLVSPGTIFRCQWANGVWSDVAMYTTAKAMGVEDSATAVIDGLAIDTVKPGGHEVLFSLRDTPQRDVGPHDQMLHAQPFTTPPKPPRRAMIGIGGKYGSLGRHMGAGRAIGDFCTADPWLPTGRVTAYDRTTDPVPDDFAFARRKPNANTGPQWVVLPIAVVRAWHKGAPQLRVCMAPPHMLVQPTSWVKVYWAYTDDVTQGSLTPGEVWQLAGEFPMPARPFQYDVPLQPKRGPEPATVRGIMARWEVHFDGRVWHSPVAPLRY